MPQNKIYTGGEYDILLDRHQFEPFGAREACSRHGWKCVGHLILKRMVFAFAKAILIGLLFRLAARF